MQTWQIYTDSLSLPKRRENYPSRTASQERKNDRIFYFNACNKQKENFCLKRVLSLKEYHRGLLFLIGAR